MRNILNKFLRFSLIVFVLSVVIGAMACSSGHGASNTKTSSPPAFGNSVTLQNFAFSPATLTVKVGTTVTWTNKDGTTHTVTSDSGVFNSGNLSPNATFSYTFNNTGTFTYHCSIHTYMTGTVIVQ